jgi:hypothetical protein
MTFPSSWWGAPNFTEVDTVNPIPGSGQLVGSLVQLFDGSQAQLLKWTDSGGYVVGAAVTPVTGTSGFQVGYNVTNVGTANTQLVYSMNDRSTVALTQNQFGWGSTKGLCNPLVLASVAAGSFLVSSATTGALRAAAAGTSLQGNIYSLVVVGGSNAQTPAVIV